MRLSNSQISLIEAEYMDDTPLSTTEYMESQLQEAGVEFGEAYYSSSVTARAIMLAEAMNWAAKVYDEWFYELKDMAVAEALNIGALGWIDEDDWGNETINLYHRDCGTASFHFPYYDINEFSGPRFLGYEKLWAWSGIPRQNLAFDLLQDKSLLSEMAYLTRPRNSYIAVRSAA